MFQTVMFAFVGGLLGALIGSQGGLFFGLTIGLLIAAVERLRERVSLLERHLATQQAPAPEPVVETPLPTAPLPVEAPPPFDAPSYRNAEPVGFDLPQLSAEAETSERQLSDDWIARARSLLFGGNPVVRAGLIVLFFGVAFLFKFAAEREMVPLEVRYLGVVVGALALIVVGWRQRHARAGFALLVQGGAVGLLYITVFSALRLHALIPAPLAFALLIALVILSGMLAVLQDARGLAVAGAVGGFLAPLLVSTGAGNHVALFSYYALLNAGVLGIAWYRAWRLLNRIGFLFTFAIGAMWGLFSFRDELFWSTEPFLILFYAIYVALPVLYAVRRAGHVDGSLVFGLPVIAFALQTGMVRHVEFALAWSALGMAAIYFALAAALWRRAGEGMRLLTESFLALAIVFTTLAIPLALEGRWTASAWALEGAALVWVGVRQSRLTARLFGILLQLGAGAFFFDSVVHQFIDATPLLNGRFLGGVCIAAGGLLSAYQMRLHERLRSWEAKLETVLMAWGILWWFGITFAEVNVAFDSADWAHAWAVITAATALGMSEAARRFAWRTLAQPLAGTGWLLLLCVALDLVDGHPFARFGLLVWGAVMAAFYFMLRRQELMLTPRLMGLLHQTGLWMALLLLATEAAWAMSQVAEGEEVWPRAAWLIVPPALTLLVIRLSARVTWPLSAWRDDYASKAPLPVMALAVVGCLVSALAMEGDPFPLAYMPLLNPLELAQIFLLLALLRWRLLAVAPGYVQTKWLDGVIGFVAFVVLNGILARAVHFYTDTPFDWSMLLRTTELQTAFAVAWTLLALALTVTAARLSRRELWLIGAALLAVVVAKLFLVDLASSNTVARIVSFLGVGALMLAIGFIAPLPPTQREGRYR